MKNAERDFVSKYTFFLFVLMGWDGDAFIIKLCVYPHHIV
jgi:hypothetical protein